MTLKELVTEVDESSINIKKCRYETLNSTEAIELGIEYRKMLALESISSALSHIDATLTELSEIMRWK